ncbi:DsbA family oxidoreductase [Clostridium estertheticum]|uniref:DsbA family oxidoreductase n=1 Tax=Clostridium estertheticum TaxID=238834 RepID=UPI001C0C0A3C|nr:DsbA family oxidoreductase [Clostridium estertheticum]MBU3213845.1 DsbA family oxidoreductase [Clostridium estertheticum]WAG53725.1 DsbA family oxidoreductase [Clostridium estertheticum]
MKIEIWSDYACPYCYIGKRRLEKALESFSDRKDIEISFKSFELDPSASYKTTTNTRERISVKYRMSSEKAQQMIDSITEYAKSVGLDFNYGKVRYTNTFDAHRIAKYAETKGKGIEISEKLLHAYFTENKQMSDHRVLTDIAIEFGLDKLEVEDILNGKKFAQDVRNDEYEAGKLGIQAVPFFLINEKYSISGAQSSRVFKKVIEKALQEEKILENVEDDNLGGMVCNSDGCSIPNNK